MQTTNSVSMDDNTIIIAEIDNLTIDGAEKSALVKIRVNQGVFRDR